MAAFGLIKKGGMNPFPWWKYPHSTLNRDLASSSSTFVNPNHFGGYLEMVVPVTLGMLLTGSRATRLLAILAVLEAIALIFSLSRGGWIGGTFGLIFMFMALMLSQYTGRRRFVLATAVAIAIASVLIISSRSVVYEVRSFIERSKDTSLKSRMLVWRSVIDMAMDHPGLGTGPGTFGLMFTQYQPPGFTSRVTMAHNDYLQVLSETGLGVIAIFGWLVIAFYRRGWDKLRHPSRLVRGTTLGAMSGVTAMLVHSGFDFNLHIPSNALLFIVLVAIAMSPIPMADRPHPATRSTNNS